MAHRNVAAVLIAWHELSHRARVVLLAMASQSLDDGERGPRHDGQNPRRYYGGVGYLAEVLYGPDGIEGYDERGRATPTPSARRQVQKSITELVNAGALTVVVSGRTGRRAEWEINLSPATANDRNGRTETTGTVASDDRNGRKVATETVPLKKTQEDLREQGREHHPPAPRDRATTAAVDDGHTIESTGQVWHDVPLVDVGDGPETVEGYADASNYLERKIGSERAGANVAFVTDTLGLSYSRAVVRVAAAHGWTP